MSSSSACRCIDDYQHGMRARGPSLRPSRSQLWLATALWRAVFFAGTLQVALSMTCAAVVAHAFDMPWPAAVLAGGAAAMCSTGITLKQLQEQREFARTHGRIATGILLFQDLATLPFLVVIDSGSAAGSIVFVTAVKQLMGATLSLGGLLWLCLPLLPITLALTPPPPPSCPLPLLPPPP